MPTVDVFKDCPGYAEAARRERELRDVPFLGLPETVGGVDCAALTLRRLMWLQLIKSPFLYDIPTETLCEKPGIENDVVAFLWIVSPEFAPGNERRKKQCYKRMGKTVLALPIGKAIAEIKEYLDEAWMDAPEGRGERSFYSAGASLTVFFAKHFGLGLDVWENSRWRNLLRRLTGQPNPLDIPLRICWQLQRAHANSQHSTTWTNKLSDAALKAWHGEDNLRLKREMEARELAVRQHRAAKN